MHMAAQKRRFTPAEIACSVKMVRERLRWSQEALAAEANLTPRTIQRIEGEEVVSDETLRRLAKAVRLDPEFYVSEQTLRTPEEIVAEAESLVRQNHLLPAARADTGHRVVEFMGAIQAYQHSFDEDIVGKAQEILGALLDTLTDIVEAELMAEMAPSQKLELGNDLSRMIDELQLHGLKVYTATHRLHLKAQVDGAKAVEICFGYLRVTRAAVETFVIPKKTRYSFA